MTRHSRWQNAVRVAVVAALMTLGAAGAEAAARVYVRVGPPPAVVDHRPAPPGRGYVWVAGYQQWSGRAFGWVPGRWVVPPRGRAVWVEPRWVRDRRGWYLVPGHWR